MSLIEFFTSKILSKHSMSGESVSSDEVCVELISLSNTTRIDSNGWTSAEKSGQKEGELISVKIETALSDMLNIIPVTFQTLHRKTSYLQHQVFRPTPI